MSTEQAKKRYEDFKKVYRHITTTKGDVINPDTFEPFNKNSKEFKKYCDNMKSTVEKLKKTYEGHVINNGIRHF